MAPKRSRVSGSASQSAPPRFLSSVTQRQHGVVGEKRLVQEIGIEIPAFDSVPRVREIMLGYGWVPFNNILGECNRTVVEEFYGNGIAFGNGDYRSYVWGVDDRNFYVIFSIIISSKMTKTGPNTKENLQKQEKASRQSSRCKKTRKSPKSEENQHSIAARWELLVRQEIRSNKSEENLPSQYDVCYRSTME
ncbi:hypothetical protein QL285_069444 [Trifolium repens]|nr:hypothetical protein QL285_069444 [Trifolium repens]